MARKATNKTKAQGSRRRPQVSKAQRELVLITKALASAQGTTQR